MTSIKNSYDSIATLGPTGTDSEAMALELTEHIYLLKSFEEVMKYAYLHDMYALVPCGYKSVKADSEIESWVDLHFRYFDQMRVTDSYVSETKPMVIARRSGCEKPKTLVIHPATRQFTTRIPGRPNIFYVDSKPEAVRLTAEGIYDMCIGSEDVVIQYEDLEIIDRFTPQMIWALYKKVRSSKPHNHDA